MYASAPHRSLRRAAPRRAAPLRLHQNCRIVYGANEQINMVKMNLGYFDLSPAFFFNLNLFLNYCFAMTSDSDQTDGHTLYYDFSYVFATILYGQICHLKQQRSWIKTDLIVLSIKVFTSANKPFAKKSFVARGMVAMKRPFARALLVFRMTSNAGVWVFINVCVCYARLFYMYVLRMNRVHFFIIQ